MRTLKNNTLASEVLSELAANAVLEDVDYVVNDIRDFVSQAPFDRTKVLNTLYYLDRNEYIKYNGLDNPVIIEDLEAAKAAAESAGMFFYAYDENGDPDEFVDEEPAEAEEPPEEAPASDYNAQLNKSISMVCEAIREVLKTIKMRF